MCGPVAVLETFARPHRSPEPVELLESIAGCDIETLRAVLLSLISDPHVTEEALDLVAAMIGERSGGGGQPWSGGSRTIANQKSSMDVITSKKLSRPSGFVMKQLAWRS